MSEFVPVNEVLLNGNEKAYLNQCIDSGWISSEGPFVRQFEEQFAARVNRQYGVSVCNGSVALQMAVAALGLGPGDEVIMPSFTIISCAAAIVYSGATPVLVDSDPCTWNMNLTEVEAKVTPRTKAIMIVHTFGLPVDMDPLLEIADRRGLRIIEDAAEMHGQEYRGRPCGSFGDLSIFSFYPNKHVTTGEGGMVVTNDPVLAEKCRSLRNLCFEPQRRFLHKELGWNFRMSNLQAAVGVAQLERLDEFICRKRRMGQRYTEGLCKLSRLQLPLCQTDYARNVYWVYGIVLDREISFDAEEAMRRLAEKGVGTRPFFWPMHEQPVFQRRGLFKSESYPVAELLARRGLYIPSGVGITDQQMDRVVDVMTEMFS
jgi:perosamine synthetase